MTREEAIRVLEDNRPSVIFEDKDAQKRMTELCKAIDMAIEALSRSGDLISRADAIEAVASITMSIHLSDVICDKLLALPSADAQMESEVE